MNIKFRNIFLRLLAVMFFFSTIALSQEKFQLNSYINNDTLLLPDIPIFNLGEVNSDIEYLTMLENNYVMSGYLVIQIDTDSYILSVNKSSLIMRAKVFWLDTLESIFEENSYYYYDPPLGREEIGFSKFRNDSARDEVSTFLYYITIYNKANNTVLGNQYLTYLYHTNNLLRTFDIENAVIWEKKDNPKLKYLFFNTRFSAAKLYDNRCNRKILFPSSWLYEFNTLDEKISNNSRSINLPLFIDNNFRISSMRIKFINL